MYRFTQGRRMRRNPIMLSVLLVAALLLSGLGAAQAATSELFFSEYIEGSSNNKALEIYNGTGALVNLATGAYNIQMYFNGSLTAGLTINLIGVVADGDVYVVANSGAAIPAILAQADQTNGAGWYNGDDAVVLRKGTTIIDVIGQIGFDPGTEWGTGLTSSADNTLRRKAAICQGDTNGADVFDPAPQWDGFAIDTVAGLGSHTATCSGPAPTNPSGSGAANPAGVEAGDSSLLTVNVTPGANPTSTGLAVSVDLSSIGGAAGQSFFDNGTNGDVMAGDNLFSYLATVAAATTSGAKSLPASITDAQARSGSASISLTVIVIIPINQIQGSAHLSPLTGQIVTTTGIVTARRSNGFYIESQVFDTDDATSEGLFVFTSSTPPASAALGNEVRVTGTVSEFRPGGSGGGGLTTTQISGPTIVVNSTGNPLPEPTIIGIGGRVPPTEIINNDGAGNVETQPPATFDPATDGIDFYESMEGMRVRVNDAVAVGPTSDFNEIFVVADGGVNGGIYTARGGILIRPTDFNPERIQLDDTIYPGAPASWPQVNVGARLTSPAIGVLDYGFGNFEVLVTETFTVDTSTQVVREVTPLTGSDERVTIGTFNVENLGGTALPPAFATRADLIVNNLGSPDIVVLEEMQDNNGATNNGVVDATLTFNNLISAIQSAGGPAYSFAQINPVNNADGGQPGGNIRVGFLYNAARVTFIPQPGGDATTANGVTCTAGAPALTLNPGRIDPTNTAFNASRKPIIGQFEFNGEQLFVVGVHFNSKGGDDPLFGFTQPPVLDSEAQRIAQAQAVNTFANSILSCAPDASVLVLGDTNDFPFSPPIVTLKGTILHNLFDLLPSNEQYSYVFEGNSQVLDQMVSSSYLFNNAAPVYDVVHVNSEFADQASDHDPSVAQFLPVLLVDLDIKPGSDTNPINLGSNGKVPAAILSTATFDATFVDPTTVTLAGAPVAKKGKNGLMYSFEDVNRDGRLDMVLHFETQQLNLQPGDTAAILLGKLFSGAKIRGIDSVQLGGSNAPVLVAPADGSTVASNTPLLEWSSAEPSVCYLVQVDTDSSFSAPVTQQATVVGATQYTTAPLVGGTYYWRVQIGGNCAGVTPGTWSETWSFNVP